MNIIESNLKFNSNHSERSGNPSAVVLHHAAASSATVETVHEWHLDNGWAGIGYHFYVRKNGSVYRGRPEKWIGAHTSGHNEKIGICAEGNFETEKMPDAQKKAIIELLAYLFDKYGAMKVYGHRDLDATACPGKNYPFDSIVEAARQPKKADADTDAAKTLYCVQVGAFDVKANAENLLAKLKKAGFDGFITTNGGTAVAADPKPVKKMEEGSFVRVKKGAKTYTGGGLADFVYERNHTVKEIDGNRVVITFDGVVVAAVHKDNLILL